MLSITMQPTDATTVIEGQKCRVWSGQTEGGCNVRVFVRLVAAAEGQDMAELEAELAQSPAPKETRPLWAVLRGND